MRVLLNRFVYDLTAPVGIKLLNIKASRLHIDTTHLVGLLCKSDRPIAEISDSTSQSQETSMPRRNSNLQTE
jgi:hypothetical protein